MLRGFCRSLLSTSDPHNSKYRISHINIIRKIIDTHLRDYSSPVVIGASNEEYSAVSAPGIYHVVATTCRTYQTPYITFKSD